MSFNVLVIPEDFTKDEHVLKPLVEKILADAGKPNARVEVCRNPNFAGIVEALKVERLKVEVIGRYRMVDLFVLLVDRDGVVGRHESVAHLETVLSTEFSGGKRRFVAELAREEVEVFLLAGHDLPDGWSWNDIRKDRDVKNTYFRKFVALKGTQRFPHDGRKKLMAEGIKNWSRIRTRCSEELDSLLEKLKA